MSTTITMMTTARKETRQKAFRSGTLVAHLNGVSSYPGNTTNGSSSNNNNQAPPRLNQKKAWAQKILTGRHGLNRKKLRVPKTVPADNLSLIRDFIANKEQKEKWSIDPDAGWHTAWDLLMVFLLAFVAIALPIELAFLSDDADLSIGYWRWNRFIDAAFFLDLVLNFFLGFEDELEGFVQRDVRIIATKYLSTWFSVDFISVLPFFLFDSKSALTTGAEYDTDALRVLQALRLLRVLKIVRLLRASRIIKRWEDRFSFRSTIVEPIKYIFLLIFVIHCMACVLELVSNMAVDQRFSWEDFYLDDDATATPSTKYLSALYWSCMTVTTIGYGDLVPRNIVETWTASVVVFVGSCIYAYVVGTIVASLSGANPAGKDFQRDLENLDDYMHLARCTAEHKWRLRAFFNKRALIGKDKYFKAVLQECSPEIQANLAALLYKDSLLQVKFMQPPSNISEHRQHHFIGQVSMFMDVEAFPAHEFLITKGEGTGNLSKMFIIRRGLVGCKGTIFSRERGKNVLGEDIICRNSIRMYSAKSLTFVETVSLRSRDLHRLLDESSIFGDQARIVHNHARWVGFRIIMSQILDRLKKVRVLAAVAGVTVDLAECPEMLFVKRGQPFDPTRAIRRMLRARALREYDEEHAARRAQALIDGEQTPQTPSPRSPRFPRSERSSQGPWSRFLDTPPQSTDRKQMVLPKTRYGKEFRRAIEKHRSNRSGESEQAKVNTAGNTDVSIPLGFRRTADGSIAQIAAIVPTPGTSGYRGTHDSNGLTWEQRAFCVRVVKIPMNTTSPSDALKLLIDLAQRWKQLKASVGNRTLSPIPSVVSAAVASLRGSKQGD